MINYIIYIIAVGSAMIVGLLLKLPLLPENPKRQSWTISAIFPTAVLALGFTAMISKLGYLNSTNSDYIIALMVGIITAIFSKYILERILPRPSQDSSGEPSISSVEPPEEQEKSNQSQNKFESSKNSKTQNEFDESSNNSSQPKEESNG
ncbi:MAG: energy-converting hydrogenase A subunit A EhaA [Methanobacterium sp.]|nr:energy-converting hydrogenase A subunit A EhaA [Methanobacterium sp.]